MNPLLTMAYPSSLLPPLLPPLLPFPVRYGYVGEITGVRTEAIRQAVNSGYVPVVLPLAETAEGQILNINADVAAREIALNMKPLKTIFINAKGGWVEPDGTKVRNGRRR